MRIGSGAGFAGDRIEPAVDLVREGALDDLVLECLAERTIALAQQRRRGDPTLGYDVRAAQWFRALLPVAIDRGTRIVSNLGAANPLGAGRLAVDIARELGLSCRVAVVTGDDVLDALDLATPCLEDGRPLDARGPVVSANAYLGADAITPALATDADVVLTGRVADPSLFLAPLADRLGWDLTDPAAAAQGTLVGHLLECGAQLTGGYFADPGRKDVPGLTSLGYPWADVSVAEIPTPPVPSSAPSSSPSSRATAPAPTRWSAPSPKRSSAAPLTGTGRDCRLGTSGLPQCATARNKRRIESLIRLAAPVLDVVLYAGDRASKVIGRNEIGPEPIRRPGLPKPDRH